MIICMLTPGLFLHDFVKKGIKPVNKLTCIHNNIHSAIEQTHHNLYI